MHSAFSSCSQRPGPGSALAPGQNWVCSSMCHLYRRSQRRDVHIAGTFSFFMKRAQQEGSEGSPEGLVLQLRSLTRRSILVRLSHSVWPWVVLVCAFACCAVQTERVGATTLSAEICIVSDRRSSSQFSPLLRDLKSEAHGSTVSLETYTLSHSPRVRKEPLTGWAQATIGPHRTCRAIELQPGRELPKHAPEISQTLMTSGSEEALISFPMETFIPLLALIPAQCDSSRGDLYPCESVHKSLCCDMMASEINLLGNPGNGDETTGQAASSNLARVVN